MTHGEPEGSRAGGLGAAQLGGGEHTGGTLREAVPGLAALTAATFVAITTEALPVGLLPQISATFDVPESTTGLLVTVYAVMVAALAVPLTVLTRHLPRKGLLVGTLVVFTAGTALTAVAPTFAVVVVGRALGGLAHALFFSLSIAYASRLVRPEFVGRAMSFAASGVSVGFVLGVPALTALGAAAGWRVAFVVLTGLSVLAVGLVLLLLRPVAAVDPAPPESSGDLRTRRRRLAIVTTANMVTFLAHFTVYTYVAVLLLAAGATPTAIGPVLLVLGAVGLLGLWFAGATLDRRPRLSALATLGAMAVGLLLVGLVFPASVPVVAGAALWTAGYGAVPSVTQAAALRTHAVSSDVAGALVNATSNVGIAGGAALGSLVLRSGEVGVLPFVGAGIVAVALVVVLVARRAFPARP
ncbi:MFS transporter [Cellulomonas sp.]|uniref:MFS transporter n=1 Tax=Cellulomonas sp. TaxID=40001 RepID=UPI0025C6DFEA|nr:MFS transporter [Cellulomonas sp.]